MWNRNKRQLTSPPPTVFPEWACALIFAVWLIALGLFGSRDVLLSLIGLSILAAMFGVGLWDVRRPRGRNRVRPAPKDAKESFFAMSLLFVTGMAIASWSEHKSMLLSIGLGIGACLLFLTIVLHSQESTVD